MKAPAKKTVPKKAVTKKSAPKSTRPAAKKAAAPKGKPAAKAKPAGKPKPAAKAKPAGKPMPAAKAKAAGKPMPAAKSAAKAKPAAAAKSAAKTKPAGRPTAAGKAKPSSRQKPGGWGRAEGKPKFRAAPRAVVVEAPAEPKPVIPAELLSDGPKIKKPRKPRGKKAEAVKPQGALDLILAQLDDAKAEQIISIPLDDRRAVADAVVVASGRSNRHVGAIADQLVQKLKEKGYRDIRIEGMPQCDWVLVDAGDVVVHIFRPEVRSFYNLEKLLSSHAPDDQWAV